MGSRSEKFHHGDERSFVGRSRATARRLKPVYVEACGSGVRGTGPDSRVRAAKPYDVACARRFGSYCHPPSTGSSRTRSASIGGNGTIPCKYSIPDPLSRRSSITDCPGEEKEAEAEAKIAYGAGSDPRQSCIWRPTTEGVFQCARRRARSYGSRSTRRSPGSTIRRQPGTSRRWHPVSPSPQVWILMRPLPD
jgi:hypothetical protein